MATSEQFEVVLRGGAPWGFRLQGGKEFRAPLRIAKVNRGGKSEKAGIREGDIVVSINGGDAQECTHSEALNAIKKSTELLVMIMKRKPPGEDDFSTSTLPHGYKMSSSFSNGYDAPKPPNAEDYARIAPFATLPRGNNARNLGPPPTKPKPKTPPSSPEKPLTSPGFTTSRGIQDDGGNWSVDMVNDAVRTPQPIKLNTSSDGPRFEEMRQNVQAMQSAPSPPQPRRVHPPPRVHQPPLRDPRLASDSDGPSRPEISDQHPKGKITPGGGWYKNMFKEMHANAGGASNLSALLAHDANKGVMRDQEDQVGSPRSMSPPADYGGHNNQIERSRKSSSSSSSSLPPSRPPYPDAGGGNKPAQWYRDIHQNLVNDSRAQENGTRIVYQMPQAPAIHRSESPHITPHKLPPALSVNVPEHTRSKSASETGSLNWKRTKETRPVVNSQDEILKREPTPTSLYESQFWKGQSPDQMKDAMKQQKTSQLIAAPASHIVSPKTEEIARQRELELQILREEEKREEQKRRQEEARWRKEEEEKRRREEERRKEEERKWVEEQILKEEEARRRSERARQQTLAMAKALYSFQAQNPSEIGFRKGDLIKITKSVDKNWFEGEFQGKVGIFPASYVEVLPANAPTVPTPAPVKTVPVEEGEGRVKYNFQPESPRELPVKKGDMVTLIRQIDQNWYEGRSANGQIGIFPVSYIEITRQIGEKSRVTQQERPAFIEEIIQPSSLQKTSTSPTQASSQFQNQSPSPEFPEPPASLSQVKGEKYRVVYSYIPQNEDELELEDGDVVTVLEKCDDGWFVGISQKTGHFGTFPGNYVKKNL